MGDQHRSDTDRAQHRDREDPAQDQTAQREVEDAQFDPSHAKTQHAYHAKSASSDMPMTPVHTVGAVGNSDAVDTMRARYADAKHAKRGSEVLAIVRDMDTARRQELAGDLDELATFLSPRDILFVAGVAQAPVDATLLATLQASPPVKREQLRAYLTDVGPYLIDVGFSNSQLVPALRARFPGSPVELLPQLGDQGGLHNDLLLAWFLDTTPPKVVARVLLAVPSSIVEFQAGTLDKLGNRGWAWLDAVDAQLAAASSPDTLATYQEHAQAHAQQPAAGAPAVDDVKHAAQLGTWSAVADKAHARSQKALHADAAALRARRADVIARSSALAIQEQTEQAGLSPTEQLDWILDKPGLTAEQLREVTLTMPTLQIELSSALLAKLQRRFPKNHVEDLFSGELPNSLVVNGATNPAIAKWLLAGAQPEAILRIVAAIPDLLDEWCAMLTATGTGYGWVRELGGNFSDKLLRRFVLKCPDVATREYIEQRILGQGDVPGKTTGAPVSEPTAYTSNRSHLDHDLDDAAKRKTASKAVSDTVSADVSELSAAELEGLRHDATRLRQVLASANPKTFPQILEHVQPELQVAITFATPDNISVAHLMSWIQTRPAHEVTTTLSSPMLVARLRGLVGAYGPLEALPASATPAVLASVLHHNPSIIEWLLASDPSRVIHALAAPSVIDAAVRALGTLEDIDALEAWPSAEALGPAGRAVLVQLSARAKGRLREALDQKLAAKLPKQDQGDDEQEEITAVDKNALTLRGSGEFVHRLTELLDRDAPASAVLALCRAESADWTEVASKKDLPNTLHRKLGIAPDVAFAGIHVTTLLGRPNLHDWILATTPAFKVLNAIDPALDPVMTATLDSFSPAVESFLGSVPRGRALSAANKTTLHRLGRLVDDTRARQLFRITFDTEVGAFSRAELDKLWSILELVPHAHVDQHTISSFTGVAGKPDDTTAGVYRPDTQGIELQKDNLTKRDAAEYDNAAPLTEAQAVEALGSRADVDRFVAEGRMTKQPDGLFRFVRQDQLELFSLTVLHEVGHAVDYMLGAKTELIYGLAGWKRFASADFDGWARDLGGWDQVTEPDKKAIRSVWISWLHGGGKGTVADMVDSEHPAVARRYAQVGVVELAHLPVMNTLQPVHDRYAVARHADQEFFSLSAKAYHASPSGYALTAPQEYFAECYANYYREYDGTPQTAPKKGATLAPWIKTWFDTNVDKAGHNPRR